MELTIKWPLVFLMLALLPMHAQDYAVERIDPLLSLGVYAVVRDHQTTLNIDRFDQFELEFEEVVTVFEKQGQRAVRSYVYYDDSRQVKDIEAKVYDETGALVETFKQKDFMDVSASGGSLYSDDRAMYLDYTPKAYPYTIAVNYIIKSNSTAFLPRWEPLPFFGVSIEQSRFQLVNSSGETVDQHQYNLQDYPIEIKEEGNSTIFTSKAIRSISSESWRPSYDAIFPVVKFSMPHFRLVNASARVNDWDDFANWQRQDLLAGLDVLDQETILEVQKLVEGVSDQRTKARLIYEYMQGRTRYISVQVGIGGWKPTPAEDVHRLGYGDCKGLTNYTKALLSSQGIPSYYTIVDSGWDGDDIDKDFVGLQGNHVILTVPLEDQHVFLECTRQDLPFGFLGTHTDNRKVMAVTPEGGLWLTTTAYEAESNSRELKAVVRFVDDRTLSGTFQRQSRGLQYARLLGFDREDAKEKQLSYREQFGHHPRIRVTDLELTNDKDSVVYSEAFNFVTEGYTKKAGNRILLNPNLFTRLGRIPEPDAKRVFPVEIRRGYTYRDEVELILPAGYSVESGLEAFELQSAFGTYSVELKEISNNHYLYTRKLTTNAGQFPKETYPDFVDFMKQIDKKDRSKIVLVKNQ